MSSKTQENIDNTAANLARACEVLDETGRRAVKYRETVSNDVRVGIDGLKSSAQATHEAAQSSMKSAEAIKDAARATLKVVESNASLMQQFMTIVEKMESRQDGRIETLASKIEGALDEQRTFNGQLMRVLEYCDNIRLAESDIVQMKIEQSKFAVKWQILGAAMLVLSGIIGTITVKLLLK